MLVLLALVGCEGPPAEPAREERVACAEETITAVAGCEDFGPVCGPAEIDLRREHRGWAVGSASVLLEHQAPAFQVVLRFDDDLDAIAPEDLADHVERASVDFEVDGITAEAGTFSGDASVPDADVVELEATADAVRVVLTAPGYVLATDEHLSSYEPGCREADVYWCPCEFEVPASVRLEVDAPLAR